MADIIVGKGTQVQVVISMTPITGDNGTSYNLDNLDWSCEFSILVDKDGSNPIVTVGKTAAESLGDGSYELLVDTSTLGAGSLVARLIVEKIPAAGNKERKEVTPLLYTNITLA